MMPLFFDVTINAYWMIGPTMKFVNFRREARIATLSLLMTLGLYGWLADVLVHRVYDSYYFPHSGPFYGGLVYLAALSIVFYSLVHYHMCLIGHYKRPTREQMPSFDTVTELYDNATPPSVTVLVPSFKEERQIMLQTLMSAALSEYPAKNVVLLIDNPQHPKSVDERVLLEQARNLPQELQARFAQQASIFHDARTAYMARREAGASESDHEIETLAGLYNRAAEWLETEALNLADGAPLDQLAGDVRFFIKTIILQPAALHREQAMALRYGTQPGAVEIARHYNRLAGLFTVTFSSFERKRYWNLSHDANKAMNLNSYMGIIGKSWKEVETTNGLELQECMPYEASFTIPATDYVNTIDADSLMTHDYIARLVYLMEQPENNRIAVAQSPCSATPGHRSEVERIASAQIDVQFHTHQGYTYWDASFWVGANAMLRTTALEAIKEIQHVDGKIVSVYIQDRTLIEDTESSIDLVHKGWKLYNYPKRMTYSASPGDFGSLLIQRRRWANGGLIILPKLLGYIWRAPKNWGLLREFFMRFNYLAMTTLSVAMLVVYSFYTFSPRLSSSLLLYANLPYLLLFSRDLRICGYRYSDALRIMAFNLMLLPVIAAGVMKQMEQIITGKKIPFGRTPKVTGRTGAPAFYYLMELGMISFFAYRVYQAVLAHETPQIIMLSLNVGFLLYALVRFIGVRALVEDLSAAFVGMFAGLKPALPSITPATTALAE
jgi:cellulose synthase (UDP-forming)